ncbi:MULTISPECIES: RidA family protein [unclassified Pseudoalteromonas]|uniref:RidA family protein n=1 Tax=unclassified Pseudoalteromonas TaxID=194690 RepID=UPI000B3C12DE|nr:MULTISPECIES: RidA family protein [unclassified Pseudoalteromonas]MDN3379669.1 RidA family protein [Pseudoalteromonas sp. APC 3893]MDN3388009.1 RidA family protein [Pseudoalteromonas sp. APC 4017]OUS74232.1 reactive intermediate/imine deaminase [Pseudoalteromonas sp. A601]
MNKAFISTEQAPAAIGTYSQAVKVGTAVYLSGQIPLVPETMEVISEDFAEQTHQVFKNVSAVCKEAGGTIQDLVKVNIYLTDLSNFATVNEVMSQYFKAPYPARAAIGVRALPKNVQVEIDGIMELPSTN